MRVAVVRWLDRWSIATGYVAALVAGSLALAAHPPRRRALWLDWSSTNLANLHDHPVTAVLASAVLADGTVAGWAVIALVGLGTCGAALGAWRTALLVTAAHVTGTAVSQGVVAYRVAHATAVAGAAHMRDTGPSYVVTAAVVAGLAYGPRPGRLACAACLAALLPGLFGGLPELAVAPVGHACSVVVALGLGALLARSVRRRPAPPTGAQRPAGAAGPVDAPASTQPHAPGAASACAGPPDADARDAPPRDAAPPDADPHDAAPRDAAARDPAPRDPAAPDAQPPDAGP